MSKYRIWKESITIKYKDVEASSEQEARKHLTDHDNNDWTITDMGLIGDHIITQDFDRVDGSSIFVDQRVKDTLERIDNMQSEVQP